MAGGSTIGSRTTIKGSIRGKGSLEVIGRIKGDVEIEGELKLAEGSRMEGNAAASHVTLEGNLEGSVIGVETLKVAARASLSGELLSPRLGIESGARIDCRVRTETDKKSLPDFAARALDSDEATFEAENVASDSVQRLLANPEKDGKKKHKGPPDPIVPALKKGAKGKKRKRRD